VGTDIRVILTTVGDESQAIDIAQELVSRHLAACVNIVPAVRSIYRWKGKVWNDEELLLVIKTRQDRIEELHESLKKLHSYELPELLALSVAEGGERVLDWIREMSAPGQPDDPEEEQDDSSES
jgi:periplasmic divalent cation tolerance protein